MPYEPRKEDRFTAGLWCTAYGGREVFGREVRPPLDPMENIRGLAACGCYGFNFHDDDLIPFGASPADTDRLIKQTLTVMRDAGIVNATGNKQAWHGTPERMMRCAPNLE